MTTSTAPAALAERIGHTLVITLNRPEARNAVNASVSIAVGDALAAAQHDHALATRGRLQCRRSACHGCVHPCRTRLTQHACRNRHAQPRVADHP